MMKALVELRYLSMQKANTKEMRIRLLSRGTRTSVHGNKARVC